MLDIDVLSQRCIQKTVIFYNNNAHPLRSPTQHLSWTFWGLQSKCELSTLNWTELYYVGNFFMATPYIFYFITFWAIITQYYVWVNFNISYFFYQLDILICPICYSIQKNRSSRCLIIIQDCMCVLSFTGPQTISKMYCCLNSSNCNDYKYFF